MATDEFTQSLYERADELESERAECEPPDDDDDDGARRPADSYVDDVRGMFDGLETRSSAVEPAQLRTSSSAAPATARH